MIMIRKKRSLSTVLALALITLAAFCPEQVTSISDQQQQQTPKATSENQPQPQPQPQAQQQQQQKQTPASQPQSTSPLSQLDQPQPQSTTDSTTKTVPQMTSNTKSSTIAQQTTQQPSTFTTTGGRNNNKQQQQTTGRHNTSSVGKARKPTSRQHGNDVRTVAATSSVTQDQQQEVARLAQLYGNTPPLFITPTRDFYIDVARHSLGFKLTTIQAIDTDGDKIEYSLQPAKFLDASPYFSINATSGELRLISKRILEPKALELIDAGNGESQDDPAPFQVEEQEQQKQLQQHEQHYQQQPDTPPSYLYFLNVVAWDGHYPSVVELKIHVSNLTHFGTNSPVRLTPEGGHRGAESLMRAKTGEFLSNLYSSAPLSQRQLAAINNSTIVLPNFVNPNLLSGPFDGSSQRVHSGESSVSLQAPTIRPGQQLDQDPRQQQQQQPIVDSNDLETPDRSLLTTVPAPNPLQQQQPSQILGQQPGADMGDKRPASLLVQQPMLLSIITIIFSCLIIAFVMLVFIVPISVKRLKKRLKTMERQHEQLSQKASNGGSSIAGSCLSHVGSLTTTNSMTTNGGGSTMGDGSRGPLSSLSQFTLASSDRSCAILPPINRQHHHHHDQQQQQHHAAINGQHQAHFRRANPLGRQSSLDSAITNQAENSYNSSQFTCNQLSSAESYLAAAQHHHHRNMVIMMMDSNGTQEPPDIHHHGGVNRGAQQITCLTTDQQQQLTTSNNGLNRINNGAIVNPVYLHQLNTTGNNGPNKAAPDNIYCPIDDEFYSTINTDSSTLVDEEIATHNYNLYTRQRDGNNNNNVLSHQTSQTVAPSQTPGHNQIGSLVGQTTGFRNYTASGSAQPMSFVRDQLVRDTGSPTQSTSSSRSSTRSLARFLSLPARHWSHQQHNSLETTPTKGSSNSSKRKGSGLFDELDFDFNATNTASELRNDRADTGLPQAPPAQPAIVEQQLAKTIARADRIGHEQQVRHKRNINHHHQDHQSSQGATGDRWEIERHKLRFLNILDEGQFGLVWRCKLKVDDTPTAHTIDRRGFNHDTKELTVAVKTLKSFAAKDVREREELLAEIEIMKLVCNHPNVVRILHCCTRDIGPTRPILLIMEHVELGKLQSFLERSRTNHQYATLSGQYKNNSLQFTSNSGGVILGRDYRTMAGSIASTSSIIDGDCGDEVASIEQVSSQPAKMELPSGQQQHSSSASMMTLNNNSTHNTITTTNDNQLTSRDLIKFIYHVAKGMEHVSSNCIVHRDLASRNILISSQRVCKIGDFGMARHMESMGDVYERHSRNTKVPVRWMAPEVLLENSFTTKSDVFSFGILMWEIVTLGSTPYRHLKTDQIIQAVARNGERPEKPEYCHELLYNIMSCCWSHDPNKRPSFQELVAQLDGLLMSTEEYIQLDQYPDHNYYNIPQTAAPFELL